MTATVAVSGAGPAGLMAAEVLSAGGARVTVYDRMPSMGRKFLMAGRGGLNLTHSEPFDTFLTRYGPAAPKLRPMLEAFPPSALIAWANGLGQETFVGSSGRVFPKVMKASSLLRAWLARLTERGVQFQLRHEWRGEFVADYTVLALGGASWPRLGSDGGWQTVLGARGVQIAPLRPANAGFTVAWSEVFKDRFAGQPLKNVALHFNGCTARGDAMITRYGIEGGAIYALSAPLRAAVPATLTIDLRPDQTQAKIDARLARRRGKDSRANFLRKAFGLSALEINLLRETNAGDAIKAVPLPLTAIQPLARAISTAGGVAFEAVDDTLQLKAIPNVYVAGEMLDWEAPTGGYLLQACFSTGAFAARGILRRIKA
ncbi:MAG: TIGR03862 family flavoprotein [Alphaproteobacteria bacterium]|nr:TIGR03862 family flavoprotein [Alphaproteobacteria bacterium]